MKATAVISLVSAAVGKLASVRDCSQAGFPYFFRTNAAGGQSKTLSH
jgi:hypothetical protein